MPVISLLPNSIPRARCSFTQASRNRNFCRLLPSSPTQLLLLLVLLPWPVLLLPWPWMLLLLLRPLLPLLLLHMLQCSTSRGG